MAQGPVLHTGRAVLRPLAPGDRPELLAVFRNPAVRRYLLDDAMVSADWMEEEIRASHDRSAVRGAGLWSVRPQGSPDLVGFVGFREFFEPPRLQLLYGRAQRGVDPRA